jgi:ATP-binding cassette subfamily C protein CydC
MRLGGLDLSTGLVIRRLIAFLKPTSKWVFLSILLGCLTILSNMALLGVSAYLISMAALQPSIAVLQTSIVGVRFFGIARGVFRYLERYISHKVTFRTLARLRVWFYCALEPLAPAVIWKYRSGDLLGRAVGDIERLEHFFVRVVSPIIIALLVSLVTGFVLQNYELNMMLVLWFFMIVGGLIMPMVAGWLGKKPAKQVVHLRKNIQTQTVDAIQGMAEILTFGEESRFLNRFSETINSLNKIQAQQVWLSGLFTSLNVLINNITGWTILGLGVGLVGYGYIDGVYLASLVLMSMASFEAVQPIPQAIQFLEENLEASRRLFEIADSEPVVTFPGSFIEMPTTPGLCVEDLSFRYFNESPYVLNNVNFCLGKGQRVAIVGPSGAGKTTILNLLLRFWDYSEGIIKLGEINLKELPFGVINKTFSVVSQNTYLFNGSIRENLLIANPKATDFQIATAVARARLDYFISELPRGYETEVGDHGLKLSGGERQRVAIARALLKDSPILLLDEPSANLDVTTEWDIIHTIYEVIQSKALLLVTHRLVGLEEMDEILVLDNGWIVERGNWDNLLGKQGVLHKMNSIQSQIFEFVK